MRRTTYVPGVARFHVNVAKGDPADGPALREQAAEGARADFDTGVLSIIANEHETTLAVAAGRAPSTG
jgi:hypothetical protein